MEAIRILCFLLLIGCSIALNPERRESFVIVSVPTEEVDEDSISSENVSAEIERLRQTYNLVEIPNHDNHWKKEGEGEDEIGSPSFPGIKNKMIKPSGGSPSSRVKVTLRGRSGVVENHDEDPYPITWDQAYSSTAKRVMVHQHLDPSGHRKPARLVEPQPMTTVPNSQPTQLQPPSPPPHEQVARMARFIVHNSNWTSMATISSRQPILGFPFANVFSVSDGTPASSSGVPYMYMTPLDISVMDLKQNQKSSLTMSLAQGEYCRSHNLDPEDPRCAHVILTGSVVKLNNGTDEAKFAKQALFTRHPDMEGWPQDHGWFFAKLNVTHILVLDYFGGAKHVTPEEYFNASP